MASAIFAHRRDVDGLMSAAIYLRAEPSAEAYFVDYGEANMRHFLERFADVSRTSRRLVIADFGLDDHHLPLVKSVIAQVVSSGVEVYWLDHHIWSERSIREISDLGVRLTKVEDREACGAELVARLFGQTDPYTKRLAEMAHRTDFHLELNCVDKVLAAVVDYYNALDQPGCDSKLGALAKRVSQGILVDAETYGDYLNYLVLESSAIQNLLKNVSVFEVGGIRVAVGFTADPLSATKTCDIIRQHFQSDIQVSVKGRKVSFRRSNQAVDCSAIAKLFRGGGHDYAASGELDFEVADEQSRHAALELIASRIKQLFDVRPL